MSAVHALANPRRIKASHRRRWKRSTGHSVYANNNPYTFIDPNGAQAACTGSRVSCPSSSAGGIAQENPVKTSRERRQLADQARGRDGRMMLRVFTAPVDTAISIYEAVRDLDGAGVLVAGAGIVPLGKIGQLAKLRRIHSVETLTTGSNRFGYESVQRMSTEEIVNSLKPGSRNPLTVKPDGRVFDGNTRILVLEERGFDVESLPRIILDE